MGSGCKRLAVIEFRTWYVGKLDKKPQIKRSFSSSFANEKKLWLSNIFYKHSNDLLWM